MSIGCRTSNTPLLSKKAAFSTADKFFTNVVKNLFDGDSDSWSKYTLFQILVE
jgi:hypothetical protein